MSGEWGLAGYLPPLDLLTLPALEIAYKECSTNFDTSIFDCDPTMNHQVILPLVPRSWLQDYAFFSEIYRIQGYDVEILTWSDIGTYLLGALMIILAVWQSVLVMMRWLKKPCHSPSKLLSTLIRSHRLSRAESKLVEKIAKQLPESIPSTALFIDPRLWDENSSGAASSDVLELKRKLFGS